MNISKQLQVSIHHNAGEI